MPWLLLLHQIPPKPPYFRAKILRRLEQAGALAVKNSAYLLPETAETREDFEWISREIIDEGGEAWLFRGDPLGVHSAAEFQAAFHSARGTEYEVVINALDSLTATQAEVAKLARRVDEIRRIDFFDHPLRGEAQRKIAEWQAKQQALVKEQPTAPAPGRIWVTRRGIRVDRIASAWLIRRFLDPQASFRFVDTASYQHQEPEQRFDMYEGEFTHEGELCTFEVLCARHDLFAIAPVLRVIAEMVHDIDLKETRYGHAETAGLARMLDGLCDRTPDDEARLERGSQLFDSLLNGFLA
jgi:hypothetical protein